MIEIVHNSDRHSPYGGISVADFFAMTLNLWRKVHKPKSDLATLGCTLMHRAARHAVRFRNCIDMLDSTREALKWWLTGWSGYLLKRLLACWSSCWLTEAVAGLLKRMLAGWSGCCLTESGVCWSEFCWSGYLLKRLLAEATACWSGCLLKRLLAEADACCIDYWLKRLLAEAAACRNGSWPKRLLAEAAAESHSCSRSRWITSRPRPISSKENSDCSPDPKH